jgi:hypothetical protein
MSDKQWWEPLIEDDGKLDWLCDHEGDYSEKINELWTQFVALREQLEDCKAALRELDLTGIQYLETPVDAVGRMRGIAMSALRKLPKEEGE